MHRSGRDHRRTRGFSLIEMAVVIGISAAMMSALLAVFKPIMFNQKMVADTAKMQAIQIALGNFVVQNGRLPCPAAANLNRTDNPANFAQETDCTVTPGPAGTASTPAVAPPGTPKTRIGSVPVRALGLADSYYADSWGFDFIYAVREHLATPNIVNEVDVCQNGVKWYQPNTSNPPVTPGSKDANGCVATNQTGSINDVNTAGTINIVDENNISLLPAPNPPAIYVLVDPGENGKGAYTADGKLHSPCGLALPTAGLDQENCNNDVTFRSAPYSLSTDLIAGINQYFDDKIIYSTRIINGSAASTVQCELPTNTQTFTNLGVNPPWVRPPSTTIVWVSMAGGGGGGGGGFNSFPQDNNSAGGGGGGAGAWYQRYPVKVSGATVAVTVGRGGGGGSGGGGNNNGFNGQDGGVSSFGALQAPGGHLGTASGFPPIDAGIGGTGGVNGLTDGNGGNGGNGGDFKLSGFGRSGGGIYGGSGGIVGNGVYSSGGGGGTTPFNYGWGGDGGDGDKGCWMSSGWQCNGSDGKAGFIKVEWCQ
ncbi:MAG: type II secretion system protein [Proteobacteria bacterium]|nr:type II secretion system protein [Pseudomonadota bacterium]